MRYTTSSNCRSRLKLGSLLQEGTYGRVYEGLLLRSKNSRVRKSSDEEGESDSSLGMEEEDLEVPEEEDIMVKSVLTGTSQSQCHLLVQVSPNQIFQSTYIINLSFQRSFVKLVFLAAHYSMAGINRSSKRRGLICVSCW